MKENITLVHTKDKNNIITSKLLHPKAFSERLAASDSTVEKENELRNTAENKSRQSYLLMKA
jgi:hypothetical protein